MDDARKQLEWYEKHELKMDDSFQFECMMCGNCCRRRSEPIVIMGADLFRIAKALDMPVAEVMAKNMNENIGGGSHAPVLTLAERIDGSCRLLRKGRCMVHQDKPAVCALFPLGRYLNTKDGTYHYFANESFCGNGSRSGKTWTLREWLDEFHIEESLTLTAAWHKLALGIVQETSKMKKEMIQGEFLSELRSILYLNYDISQPYISQIEKNEEMAKEVFQKRFHKTLQF